jgi:hypothetical protein
MNMATSGSIVRRDRPFRKTAVVAAGGREGVAMDRARQLEDELQKNVSLQSARFGGPPPLASGRDAGDSCALLTERELEEIRRGLRAGAGPPMVRSWIERLLADHDERVRRDRALAVRLLSAAHE